MSGIYAVLYGGDGTPRFLKENPAGHFKGNNPTEDIEKLKSRWIDGCPLLYVGETLNLRERIQTLMEYAAGEPVSHWGGRYMWQIENAETHIVCWRPTENNKSAKKAFLNTFINTHNDRKPFANIK